MTGMQRKQVQGILLFLIAGLVSLLFPAGILAAGETDNLDAVIVMDVSGSMKTTDEKRISLEGAKLFIDMMESLNSRAGFTAFDSKVTTKYDLTALDSTADKQKIKDAIASLEYGKGDTNIGEALEQSVQMLENAPDTGNKKMILLFTDGNIDLDNRPNVESDAEKASLQAAKDATARAAEEGIQIFTIGLNAGKNDRFQMDPTLITELAESANGICRVVSSADELPGAFNDIFAHIIDSEIEDLGEVTIADPEVYEEKEIHIPNESVLEANVILFTGDPDQLDEVLLTDPDQNTLDPDDEQLFYSNSNVYQMLKIIAPKAGDWLLQMKGKEGSIIHVDLVFNYDITMETTMEPDDSQDLLHVSARLLKKGKLLTDEAIYSQLTAEASAKNTNGTDTTLPMTLNEEENYVCDVPVKEGEAVTIRVHIEGANMYRDSEDLEYSRIPPEAEEPADTGGQAADVEAGSGSETSADGTVADDQNAADLSEGELTEGSSDGTDEAALTADGSAETQSLDGTDAEGDAADARSLGEGTADDETSDDDFQVPGEDSEEELKSERNGNFLTRLTDSYPFLERFLRPDVGIAAGLCLLILILVFLMRKR